MRGGPLISKDQQQEINTKTSAHAPEGCVCVPGLSGLYRPDISLALDATRSLP